MQRDFIFDLREASGALGDLGTLIPLTMAAVLLGGLQPTPVLLGFAAFYAMTALVYRLPVPVQPMKAVVAVLLVTEMPPEAVALAGVLIGAVLVFLGMTGLIDRLVRLVPQSVASGLQLGLGLLLGLLAIDLMAGAPVVAGIALAGLGVLVWSGLPAALIFVGLSVVAGRILDLPDLVVDPPAGTGEVSLVSLSVFDLALPQLTLTLTNAVLLTVLVMRDAYGDGADRVTARNLTLTSGFANLCLSPFGALPMCHGAGGATAHYRFGARSGGAPLMIGALLAALALLPGGFEFVSTIPGPALGALLLIASADLAFSRRLIDAKPSCRPVIAVTAAGLVFWSPLVALALGTSAEIGRKFFVHKFLARSGSHTRQ